MKRKYKVPNHKKVERVYTPVSNISEYIDALDAHGERTMFEWKENGERREMSYSEFASLSRDFAKGLQRLFGKDGDRRIAVIGETSPYWVIAYLGTIASGNVIVPIDKELDPSEMADFFELASISAVIYSHTFADVFPKMLKGHKSLKTLIPMESGDASGGKNTVSYNKILLMGRESGENFTPDTDAEKLCEILFTSGTTGSSKCVMLCQKNIFSVVTSACETVDFCANDVLVSVLPLHHTYELACTLAASNYGAKTCINDSLRHVIKNFKEYQPTGLVLVPLFVSTMYKKILSEAKRSGKDKILTAAAKVAHYLSFAGIDMSERLFKDVRDAFGGRLEKIICGGAALDPQMIELFDSFGISIYEGYGITECSPLVAVTPYYKRKCGSVGTTVPCCETRIEGVSTNEQGWITGEIQVKGDNVMLGYMNNEEANNAAFTDDGWFKTGDIGYKDDGGYIFITGRQKSVIVLDNGKNVFPEEIEEYLAKIDVICESVVVGRREDDETKLVAVIYPSYQKYPDLSESEIRTEIQKEITALNKKLPSFKQIHKLEFRKTEFEKTTTKKIKRHLVK